VAFTPKDEDYGFVTVEAFASGKLVITTRDSGGPGELVRDGVNGWVTEATPASVAAAMARAFDDPAAAERMGQQGRRDTAALTWHETVRRLTSDRLPG
jgi:glycosyltransferase involved in cell wall biosynthesis